MPATHWHEKEIKIPKHMSLHHPDGMSYLTATAADISKALKCAVLSAGTNALEAFTNFKTVSEFVLYAPGSHFVVVRRKHNVTIGMIRTIDANEKLDINSTTLKLEWSPYCKYKVNNSSGLWKIEEYFDYGKSEDGVKGAVSRLYGTRRCVLGDKELHFRAAVHDRITDVLKEYRFFRSQMHARDLVVKWS